MNKNVLLTPLSVIPTVYNEVCIVRFNMVRILKWTPSKQNRYWNYFNLLKVIRHGRISQIHITQVSEIQLINPDRSFDFGIRFFFIRLELNPYCSFPGIAYSLSPQVSEEIQIQSTTEDTHSEVWTFMRKFSNLAMHEGLHRRIKNARVLYGVYILRGQILIYTYQYKQSSENCPISAFCSI